MKQNRQFLVCVSVKIMVEKQHLLGNAKCPVVETRTNGHGTVK